MFPSVGLYESGWLPKHIDRWLTQLSTGDWSRHYACPHILYIGVFWVLIGYMMGCVLGRKILVVDLLDINE